LPNITELIKQVAMDAVNAGDPSCIMPGVLQADGTVQVDQKFFIPADQVVYAATARDVPVTVTVDGKTGTGTAHLGVRPGDSVLMIRQNGGQKYLLVGKKG
jgi:hypothetical protein